MFGLGSWMVDVIPAVSALAEGRLSADEPFRHTLVAETLSAGRTLSTLREKLLIRWNSLDYTGLSLQGGCHT